MDPDDWALVLPPPEAALVVHVMGTSAVPMAAVPLARFAVEPNHPSAALFGPRACSAQLRHLLEANLTYAGSLTCRSIHAELQH